MLDDIPEINESEREDFSKSQLESPKSPKYADFDLIKSTSTEPKLDSSAVSVSSRGKSNLSQLSPSEAEAAYKTQMKNSKFMAKLKKKK